MTEKKQFNVYIPLSQDSFITDLVDETAIDSKSDAIQLLIAYGMKFFTPADWNRLNNQMKLSGLAGLQKV